MKSQRSIVWLSCAVLLATGADACRPGLNLPDTITMKPGPGARLYRLLKNVTCQGGIAEEYERQISYELCETACQKLQLNCVGINFIVEDETYFKCQIMDAISSLVTNDKSICYKME